MKNFMRESSTRDNSWKPKKDAELTPRTKASLTTVLKNFDKNGLISALEQWQALDLSNSGLADTHVNFLSETLSTNKTVTSINLKQNDIGKEGLAALKKVLDDNHSILKINLDENKKIKKGDLGEILFLVKRNVKEAGEERLRAKEEADKRIYEAQQKAKHEEELRKLEAELQQEEQATLETKRLETLVESFQDETKALEAENDRLEKELNKTTAELASTNTLLQQATTIINGLKTQLDTVTEANKSLQEHLTKFEKEVKSLEKEKDELQAQLDTALQEKLLSETSNNNVTIGEGNTQDNQYHKLDDSESEKKVCFGCCDGWEDCCIL